MNVGEYLQAAAISGEVARMFIAHYQTVNAYEWARQAATFALRARAMEREGIKKLESWAWIRVESI